MAKKKGFGDLLRQMIGPFNADMQTKAVVASCYLRDGADLLELAWMGWKSDRNNRSYRSKVFTNLRMAIECYLKGMVVSYSEDAESPEDAYNTVRKAAHKLSKLLTEVQKRSKWKRDCLRRTTSRLIGQIDKMKVGLRYEIDMSAEFDKESFEEQMLETGPMTGTIASDQWMLSLFDHVAYIANKADKAFEYSLDAHRSYVGSDAVKRMERIRQFFTNVNIY